MKRRLLSATTLLALAGCVSAPRPVAPPPRPAAPAPAPLPSPPAVDWVDRALTPGIWTYSADARGSIAHFGIAGQNAALTLRCDRAAARVILSRSGSTAARITLRATTGARAYTAQPVASTPPYVAIELAPADPQLDALAFSRGRIMIELDGQPPVIAPSWPEITRVIEDCRR